MLFCYSRSNILVLEGIIKLSNYLQMSVSPQFDTPPSNPQLSASGNSINLIQLSKPFLSKFEISLLIDKALPDDIQKSGYKSKRKEIFTFFIQLVRSLQFPSNILQNSCYLFQRFYLFNDYDSFRNMHHEVAITSLFITLKSVDYIKKLNVVITEANKIRNLQLDQTELDEQRKKIMSLEKKFLELQSYDFRNTLTEDILIKLAKYFEVPKELTYLSWSILNDSYFTPLVLQLPPHHLSMVVLKLSVLVWNKLNENNGTLYGEVIDQIRTSAYPVFRINNRSINLGVDELLDSYLDINYENTFLQSVLIKLKLITDTKDTEETILSIMTDISSKERYKNETNSKISYDKDLYFNIRDYDIAKVGSVRFLYNKKNYLEEINHKPEYDDANDEDEKKEAEKEKEKEKEKKKEEQKQKQQQQRVYVSEEYQQYLYDENYSMNGFGDRNEKRVAEDFLEPQLSKYRRGVSDTYIPTRGGRSRGRGGLGRGAIGGRGGVYRGSSRGRGGGF